MWKSSYKTKICNVNLKHWHHVTWRIFAVVFPKKNVWLTSHDVQKVWQISASPLLNWGPCRAAQCHSRKGLGLIPGGGPSCVHVLLLFTLVPSGYSGFLPLKEKTKIVDFTLTSSLLFPFFSSLGFFWWKMNIFPSIELSYFILFLLLIPSDVL